MFTLNIFICVYMHIYILDPTQAKAFLLVTLNLPTDDIYV